MTLLRILFCALPTLAVCPRQRRRSPTGRNCEGFDYPWPVSHFRFSSQGTTLDMAYMDVKPTTPYGETAVLFHGKNFCAATWEATIRALIDAGYRVIAPDQIGFWKSSKPRITNRVSATRREHARAVASRSGSSASS